MDASNLLKPALARGKLRTIGATTLKEYRKYVEKDAAFERRFQQVLVDEPSVKDSISILRGVKDRYESHHGVNIRDNALVAAVTLSDRYISDRFLPDKAIDLVDEATSALKIEVESKPAELDNLDRSSRRLEIERESLKSEDDDISSKRLLELESELAKIKEKSKELHLQWQSEKKIIDNVKESRTTLDQLKAEAKNAERNSNLQRVAEIMYGEIPAAEESMKKLHVELANMDQGRRILREEVTAEDIAEVVSSWTGIPISRMMAEETARLSTMENQIALRVVGQEDAIRVISNAVRRNRTGISEEGKPIGSFIFLGPTGVGKTELAKALAEFMFNDERAITRIDMSEYMEKHSVARLIGAPPGYVGYEEGGQLTEAIIRKPYSVILLDEIEKAHPEVYNVLLQMLDDGRLTDSLGRIVDFKNTVIIMTSNLGSREVAENIHDREKQREKIGRILKKAFRPEFLNRVDDLLIFQHLNRTEIRKIARMQLNIVMKRLEEKEISFEITDKALDYIASAGFDEIYGARPLKRLIQNEILDELSMLIVKGKIQEGDRVEVDCIDGKIIVVPMKRSELIEAEVMQ
jgi:ATP-dependent Clp protease ATP-binding subunit ClpB